MTDFIVCVECNCKYDNKHIGRDFRYKANGEPFDTCAYCRGIKKPCHYTCDTCNKTRIHYDYILLIKTGDYHTTCSDCLGDEKRESILREDRSILTKYMRR